MLFCTEHSKTMPSLVTNTGKNNHQQLEHKERQEATGSDPKRMRRAQGNATLTGRERLVGLGVEARAEQKDRAVLQGRMVAVMWRWRQTGDRAEEKNVHTVKHKEVPLTTGCAEQRQIHNTLK